MQATLDTPFTLNPQQAAKLVIHTAFIDFDNLKVAINFDLVDGSGAVIDRRTITVSGGAVTTWINAQQATIYGRLLAALGVTGTVA